MRHEQQTPQPDPEAPALRLAESPPRERRRHERTILIRPCKLRPAGQTRYLPASTTDVSAGGALIRVSRDRPFKQGEQIQVGVDWGDTPILTAEALVPARVVRIVPMDRHEQAIGVAFDRPVAEALPRAA